MIKIEKEEIYGWEAAIRGMRNPMNSWSKSDSEFGYVIEKNNNSQSNYVRLVDIDPVSPNDLNLMKKLAAAGTDHRKFMRMITVYMDITAPLYWWKEFDTYKVGTVANSCSTMHKIADKEFTVDDFSCEHLLDIEDEPFTVIVEVGGGTVSSPLEFMRGTVDMLNGCRERYLQTKEKQYWWQLIQLLPSSYNQKRTVMLNYEVLSNIYHSRKAHKLDEWRIFCSWIETLPHSELITQETKQE